MTTDKNNPFHPDATAPGFKIAARLRGEKGDVVFTSCSGCFQKNLQARMKLPFVFLSIAAVWVACGEEALVKGFNGALSPDGTTLAFQRDAGAETWLGLYDLRTGASTWAEKGPGRAAFPCWTRTGDLFYSYGNELHTAFETWKGNLPEPSGTGIM